MANAAILGPVDARDPRGVVEILGSAFELYKRNAALLIVTAAVAMGPIYLLKDVIVASALAPVAVSGIEEDTRRMNDLGRQVEEARARGASGSELQAIADQQVSAATGTATKGVSLLAGFAAMLLALLVALPLIALASLLAQAALTAVVAARVAGGDMTSQQAWGVVMKNAGPLLFTLALVVIGVAVGIVCFVVPGILFCLFAAFTVPVVLLEKKSGTDAIKRSFELVRADWMRVVLVLIAFALLRWVAAFVGALLVPSRFIFLHMLLGDLVSIAVLPIPIIGIVLLYLDILKTGQHVSDEELRARQAAMLA
jgi:hypothetical protein